MSEKPLVKFRKHRVYAFIAIFFVLIALLMFCMQYALKKISLQQDKIASKLQEELGFPISFDHLEADWFGFSLGISLENVLVKDPTVPVGFISIAHIQLFPEINTLIFDKNPIFRKIVLQGFKMVVGLDEKEGLSILGLKGEAIPTLIDYSQFIHLLSKQKSIIFEDSRIDWQGKNITVKQLWEGEFYWDETDEKSWLLEGMQQLQMDNNQLLPAVAFKISAKGKSKELQIGLGENDELSHCKFQLTPEEQWGLSCHAQLKDVFISQLFNYYTPKVTDPAWLHWFGSTALKGQVTNANIKLEGLVSNPSWQTSIDFKEVEIRYAPEWPVIHQATGIVKVNNHQANVNLTTGKILDSKITEADIIIDWNRDDNIPVVEVAGILEGTLENGLAFLEQSPLKQSVFEPLENLEPKGSMHLNLNLSIPLVSKQEVKVIGALKTKQATIKFPKSNDVLNDIQGLFQFSENGLNAKGIKAHLLKQVLTLDLSSDFKAKQKMLEVSGSGVLTSKFLQKRFQYPLLKQFLGKSIFLAELKIPFNDTATEWTVRSDLQGMAIQLPGFLGKEAKESRKMLLWVGQHQGEDGFSIHLKDILDAKFTSRYAKGKSKTDSYTGHLVFGKNTADWTSKEALLIGGEILSLNVSEWQDFFESFAKNNAVSFPKYEFHVLVDRLELSGLLLEKTWVTASAQKIPEKWRLEGPFISGKVFEDKQKIQVDLEHLNAVVIENNRDPNYLTNLKNKPLFFSCQKFQYKKKDYGNLSFKIIPRSNSYAINDLKLETPQGELFGQGEWHVGKEKSYTLMEGKLVSENMGEALGHLGYPSEIRESRGYIYYTFKWFAAPFRFNMENVEGVSEFKLEKGRILGVDPGLGRVMGLLNLENIRRRLQLDFSDLLKKGFVFDTMRGILKFDRGIAKTESLLIDGPSAKIELSGRAELKTKAIDLKMTIFPHMGWGLPIAAAIASGNPAIGAGVWILDKITGSKIKKITEHRYHVTGTWDAPKIKDLEPSERSEKSH